MPSLALLLLVSLPTVTPGGHLFSLRAVRTISTLNLPHFMFSELVVFCLGSVFQCAATSLVHIFIGRAVGGIGVGALRYILGSLTPEVD